nr:uncharacterized protein LOC129386629 [Dermacentor andersoni]
MYNTETGSTCFVLPVYRSSGGVENAGASTSYTRMEEPSDIFRNDARRQCSGGAASGMAEESNSGHTPPAFTFGDEATPSTSQEFFEGTSCTSDCGTTICDDSFEDLWNALNSHNDASEVTGHTHVTESGITSSPRMVSSSSINHAQRSTSRAGIEEASAIPENIASLSDHARRYQWNTQQRPITDGTYIYGVTDNGSPSYLHLGSSSSLGHARPRTSRTGMEQASAIIQGGTRAYTQHRNRMHLFQTSGL